MTDKRVYADDKMDVVKRGEYLELKYKTPHLIRIKASDTQAIDDEVVRMLKIRTEDGRKYFIQQEVGKVIGVSRQMINRRWQVYKQEGLLALLSGAWQKSKITPELLDRLAEICVGNPFLFVHEIKEQLQSEGVCGEISARTLSTALSMMDGRKLIKLMREKARKKAPKVFMKAGYMIERLFKIIEVLFTKIPEGAKDDMLKQDILSLKSYFRRATPHRVGPSEKDKYQKRKKLERDKKRNRGFLSHLITKSCRTTIECPDCHSEKVKFVFKRERTYKAKLGEHKHDYSCVYKCLNEECRTKYFTQPPHGVELYARVHKDVKKMALRWVFHMRGSLSRVRDELQENGIHVSLTTVMRWIKKAGEECVNAYRLYAKEDWEQPICIDEKWIKVRHKWCYVYTGVGTKVTDLLAFDLFYLKDKNAFKTFLLEIKSSGFRPKIIITDLLAGYESIVKEVFPDCYYHQCVLHAERDAKRIVRIALSDGKSEEWKKILTRCIRNLFRSKKAKQVKKRYSRIMRLRGEAPGAVAGVFDMLQKYYPKLYQSVLRKDIPKTTNAVERAIGEFEERYQLTKGFTSFYYAQFFLKAYQVYYRLRKISFGPFRGKNRLELKGNSLGELNFTDYLTPTFS
jgi:transposase-like protein/transposase